MNNNIVNGNPFYDQYLLLSIQYLLSDFVVMW